VRVSAEFLYRISEPLTPSVTVPLPRVQYSPLPLASRARPQPSDMRQPSAGFPAVEGLRRSTPSSVTSKRWPFPPSTRDPGDPGLHGAAQVVSVGSPSASLFVIVMLPSGLRFHPMPYSPSPRSATPSFGSLGLPAAGGGAIGVNLLLPPCWKFAQFPLQVP
jgi:hypothetical protein